MMSVRGPNEMSAWLRAGVAMSEWLRQRQGGLAVQNYLCQLTTHLRESFELSVGVHCHKKVSCQSYLESDKSDKL